MQEHTGLTIKTVFAEFISKAAIVENVGLHLQSGGPTQKGKREKSDWVGWVFEFSNVGNILFAKVTTTNGLFDIN